MAEKNNSIESVVGALMKGVETVFTTKTVVGEATKVDDTIIVPLVDVSFGFGAGASGSDKKDGGGGGMSGKMSPSAILLIKDGQTRLVNIKNQDTVTKVLDMVPDIVERFTKKADMMDADAAKDIAFPEDMTSEDDTSK